MACQNRFVRRAALCGPPCQLHSPAHPSRLGIRGTAGGLGIGVRCGKRLVAPPTERVRGLLLRRAVARVSAISPRLRVTGAGADDRRCAPTCAVRRPLRRARQMRGRSLGRARRGALLTPRWRAGPLWPLRGLSLSPWRTRCKTPLPEWLKDLTKTAPEMKRNRGHVVGKRIKTGLGEHRAG